MIIFKYALLRAMRSPAAVFVNAIVPIAIMFVPTFWENELAAFGVQGYGFLAFSLMGGAFLMSMGILADRVDGVVTRILASPATMRRYLVENLMSCMVVMTAQVSIITVLGFVLYDWSVTLAIVVFLSYTMLSLCSVAMSFAWHCLFKSKEASIGAFGMVLTLSAMLGGSMVPIELLPGMLEHVGAVFPVYWMMRGINSVLEYGSYTVDFALGIAAMGLFTVAFLLYGGRRRLV